MTRNFPVFMCAKDDQVSSVIVAFNVRTSTHMHGLGKKCPPIFELLKERFDKNRSTNTTPLIPAAVAADKYKPAAGQLLLHSRFPSLAIHDNILNEAIDIRFFQAPSTKKQINLRLSTA